MSNLSFDIKSSMDFLNKLLEDYKEYCLDKTSSRVALNCAMTAWHLTEWVYNEFSEQLFAQFDTLQLFKENIKNQCPSLKIMQDITNGTKHYMPNHYKPLIIETKLHGGAYSSAYSRDYDISTLEIKLQDGSKIYFEDEIEKAISFWVKYLQSLQ